MEYYLIQLSYTAAAWRELIQTASDLDDRLAPVNRLLRELKGSFADFHFFSEEANQDTHHIRSKFVPFGPHDILAIIALPDNLAARTFAMAISAEEGVRNIQLTPMIPLAEAINGMRLARTARDRTRYTAPGMVTPQAPRKAPARRGRAPRT